VLYHQTGRKQDALDVCQKIIDLDPYNANAFNNLAVLLRELGDLDGAIVALRMAISFDKKYIDAHYNLGVTYLEKGCYHDAIKPLTTVSHSVLGHYPAHSNLARALHETDQTSKALTYGKRALQEKDKESCSHFKQDGDSCSCHVPLSRDKNTLKNIISFSLWGDNTTYTIGAIENIRLSKKLYPGWICRFYCDNSVPSDVITQLQDLGGEVDLITDMKSTPLRPFWRFFVSDDDSVDRFICRDCDSILNTQEKTAVDEWIHSGQPFHIMRDSVFHTELVLAGMWGGKSRVIPNMTAMIHRFL